MPHMSPQAQQVLPLVLATQLPSCASLHQLWGQQAQAMPEPGGVKQQLPGRRQGAAH